jgi:hypothetical protein
MRKSAGIAAIAEALFNVNNLNRPPQLLMTDTEFLEAMREIMQSPVASAAPDDKMTAYPSEGIAS